MEWRVGQTCDLIHNSWVQQIGFLGGTTQNVTYIDTLSEETHTITAKEMIVSGSAINSPQLLILSGIGPKAQLSALNIPVVADIPGIGSNLYDHHYSSIEVAVTSDIETFWQWDVNTTGAALAKSEYAANESGPLGWNNGNLYAGFRLPDSVFEGTGSTCYTSLPQDRPQVLVEYSTVPFIQPAPNVSIITGFATVI